MIGFPAILATITIRRPGRVLVPEPESGFWPFALCLRSKISFDAALALLDVSILLIWNRLHGTGPNERVRMRGSARSLRTSKSRRSRIGAFIAAKRIRSLPNENRAVQANYCVFAACSASVIHLSAISMKKVLCCEVRAASAKRMHSAAFSRN